MSDTESTPFPVWRMLGLAYAVLALLVAFVMITGLTGDSIPQVPAALSPVGDVALVWLGWWLRGSRRP